MGRVTIIIVNWNTGELLARCLSSLANLPERELIYEVIVVDNASHDRSVVGAQVVVGEGENKPPVRFIKLTKNVGFAGANNIAIERVRRGQRLASHVLLLNPDTEIKRGALEAMLRVFDRDEHIGIVGPRLLNPDGTGQPSVRAFPSLGVFIWLFLKLHRLLPKAPLWQCYMQEEFDYDSGQAVDQVMGAAFLIHHDLLEEIGALDERFWIWFEEVDYCKRAQKVGWVVFYTPSARVLHYRAASFNQLVGWRRSWPWLKSSLRYARKHLGSGAVIAMWLLLPAAVLLTIPSLLVHILQRQQNKPRL